MINAAVLKELEKLTPAQLEVVKDFARAESKRFEVNESDAKFQSLREVLRDSPFSKLRFDPESIRFDVRSVDL